LYDRANEILTTPAVAPEAGAPIGMSREGRPVRAFRFGGGPQRISLLAGCHADEPVGPRLLRHLVAHLSSLPAEDPMLQRYEWWIVPHINPDGEERNRSWQPDDATVYKIDDYLAGAVRELPGDDIEFGFPTNERDEGARPENRAVCSWWREAEGPFALHVSLHGMAFAAGPWFLIEAAWKDRCARLKDRCAEKVEDLGHLLHDVERRGEKGFFRLGRGFCTRPDSRYMREHFIGQGDPETAALFRPSSMETIRSLGGDPLTLVSEMPLFITPGVGESLGPPDPVAEEWKARIEGWKEELERGGDSRDVAAAASVAGLKAMPVTNQMVLQWTFVAAGLEQLELAEKG
jgi:hypothetical protein